MIEKIFALDQADPQLFYGAGNTNLQMLKALYPKLRIVARDRVLKILGDEEELCAFEDAFGKLEEACLAYNRLTEEMILEIVKGKGLNLEQDKATIVYNMNGKPIQARGENQHKMVESFTENDLTFAIGPAGTGKTYIGIALAVRALKERHVRRIILCRPAVEAGEKLGFLPGDMKDKIDPYLQPLYDALQDMLPTTKLKELTENNIIQIAPLAFMRGRTLNDAVVLLDEAQNCTVAQMKMFLTRMGTNTKMVVTGDATQIDLPKDARSGLLHALQLLKKTKGVGMIELDKKDIVRHKLVQRIVEAYERDAEGQRKRTASTASKSKTEKTNIQS